ncbi:50S ribosomal protein L13 [Candidatus Nitronereus thalassa]|uniref:Large ribosomal subunit protein uL13 n=1 Tax=Candidatus Nitronereus thalassa TaxID=3020898 RepID=A0ABU3K6D4_9BACT|nr:50S ribosomal protein L13 [Candidatus Nitronereus thalassa]MDT7041955.1 50S ribosomal protein L13 [Candidatus Nitronereus thalassa]
MRTFQAKPLEVTRRWHILDAKGATLGRLATQAATLLRGKHKPTFTPNVDTGDHVIVVNAKEVRLTGKKMKTKTYYNHSGYPGGLKSISAERLMVKKPTEVVNKAIRGMLPKTPLGKQMARKLRIYAGSDHPHSAQNPEPWS